MQTRKYTKEEVKNASAFYQQVGAVAGDEVRFDVQGAAHLYRNGRAIACCLYGDLIKEWAFQDRQDEERQREHEFSELARDTSDYYFQA